jgi:ATP-dependent DNA helicase RecG
MDLDSSIQFLKGVGPKMAENLERLKITRPIDLLFHFPRTYIDFSSQTPIGSTRIDESAVIFGKISGLTVKRTPRKWMSVVEFLVTDSTGQIKVIYFNQPYLKDTFKEGDQLHFYGRVGYDFQARMKSMSSPMFSKEPRVIPVYPETKNVTSKYLAKLISQLLGSKPDFQEFLPEGVIKEFKLLDEAAALGKMHCPQNLTDTEQGKKRFVFEELFLTALKAQLFRRQLKEKKSFSIPVDDQSLIDFTQSLPFKLTGAQKKAAWQIITDIKKEQPMNRLLNGDVGSGKTVVAAMAIYAAKTAGLKSIFLAPTEILASQHFESLKKTLKPFNFKIGLLTASRKEKGEDFDLLIGTHALLFDSEPVERVGLVVIDEQHRFGVEQRKELHQKYQSAGRTPHLLSMTATPIPRTLQLTLYGDLDVSIIDELPSDRKKIKTTVFADQERKKAEALIRNEITVGRQVFVVCPLIDEAENGATLFDLDRKSVNEEYKRLKDQIFPEYKIGLLHGKLKTKEKAEVMDKFSKGEIDILVSTSVVEVGVDIPNASVMMVEDAERFGLAQLHQFRGRVGRAQHQSYCLLMTRSLNPTSFERLKALEECESGFQLAEIDLKQRGPGQIYGQVQSGFDNLRLEWISDIFILEEAREAAKKTLANDPDLSAFPRLKAKLAEKFDTVHLE